MDARTRVFTALRHEEPDRVPFNLRLDQELVDSFRRKYPEETVGFEEHFRHDIRYAGYDLPPQPDGVPLAEWYPLPSASELDKCRAKIQSIQAAGWVACSQYQCGVYEYLKHQHGDVEVLTLPYENPGRLDALLERVAEHRAALYGHYARLGVDIVWIGDDLGAQNGLIMSPEHYRQWYKPRHRRIVESVRKLNPSAKIAFHCCGHVTPLIGDLIEIGVDILEAVQAETMDIAGLKRDFGQDIVFWGAVGAQSVLARATPRQVMEGVRRTLEVMAPGGGYIAAPCHTLTREVPWESIEAFHEAVARYGSYPTGGRKR